MSLKHNSVCTETFKSIIENYLAYFHVIKKDYLSATKPVMITQIDVKISLNAFTSRDCIVDTLKTLNVDFDSTLMVVSLKNENPKENPINAYKQFCHDFFDFIYFKIS